MGSLQILVAIDLMDERGLGLRLPPVSAVGVQQIAIAKVSAWNGCLGSAQLPSEPSLSATFAAGSPPYFGDPRWPTTSPGAFPSVSPAS